VHRRAAWLAWSVVATFLASTAGLVALSAASGTFREPINTIALLLAFSAFTAVGALILAHRPGNAIGWVFSAVGLLAATGGLAEEYAFGAGGGLPVRAGAVAAAWWASWTWYPALALATAFTLFLFPTGRLLSPRWRPALWVTGAVTVAFTVLAAVQPTLGGGDGPTVPNPLAVGSLGNPEHSVIGLVLLDLLLVMGALALVSMVLRFQRSRGDERQQLKWFTYAGALVPLMVVADLLPGLVGDLLFATVIALLPVAAGIGILRHRLYDIDRLINRTLVYALLTALLAGVYAGLVLGLSQGVFGLGSHAPSWLVAGATLAVAALFQPARRRIQGAVDRRFDRRRYDAGRTIEAFSVRLRDHVDLGTLTAELLAVVDRTVQPTTASLWLRRPG
jgi:hypothetical protein